MTRILLVLGFVALLLPSRANGLDLPFDLGFQLGFDIQVVPSSKDTSRNLCLVVTPHKVRSDKTRALAVSGTIANYSGIPCEGVEMNFAVTSYTGIGTSNDRAVIEPNPIPPGGTATFTAHITLQSENPRFAMYTITAKSPALCGQSAIPGTIAPPISKEMQEIGESLERFGDH